MNIYRLVIYGRLWPGILLLLDIPPNENWGNFGNFQCIFESAALGILGLLMAALVLWIFRGLGGRKLCREREGNIVAEEQISLQKSMDV